MVISKTQESFLVIYRPTNLKDLWSFQISIYFIKNLKFLKFSVNVSQGYFLKVSNYPVSGIINCSVLFIFNYDSCTSIKFFLSD